MKNVLVSCSDGSLGCVAGEGGIRGGGSPRRPGLDLSEDWNK